MGTKLSDQLKKIKVVKEYPTNHFFFFLITEIKSAVYKYNTYSIFLVSSDSYQFLNYSFFAGKDMKK